MYLHCEVSAPAFRHSRHVNHELFAEAAKRGKLIISENKIGNYEIRDYSSYSFGSDSVSAEIIRETQYFERLYRADPEKRTLLDLSKSEPAKAHAILLNIEADIKNARLKSEAMEYDEDSF